MNEHRIAQLEEALQWMGGTHTLVDVIDALNEGRMHSFVNGETWAVTEFHDLPQKRVLDIFLVVGTMPEAIALHDIVLAYAKAHGCKLVRTFAREGWGRWAKERGWQNGARIFLKEI